MTDQNFGSSAFENKVDLDTLFPMAAFEDKSAQLNSNIIGFEGYADWESNADLDICVAVFVNGALVNNDKFKTYSEGVQTSSSMSILYQSGDKSKHTRKFIVDGKIIAALMGDDKNGNSDNVGEVCEQAFYFGPSVGPEFKMAIFYVQSQKSEEDQTSIALSAFKDTKIGIRPVDSNLLPLKDSSAREGVMHLSQLSDTCYCATLAVVYQNLQGVWLMKKHVEEVSKFDTNSQSLPYLAQVATQIANSIQD